MRHSILLLVLLLGNLATAQIDIPNGDFEGIDPLSTTGATAWKAGGAEAISTLEPHLTPAGKSAMKLSRTVASGKGEFNQEFPFTSKALTKYKITAAMKATHLKGRAGIGARIFDAKGNTISGNFALFITQDQDWKMMEGECYANEAAAKVRLFCLMEGAGEVWFDDIAITEIPLSDAPLKPSIARYLDEYFTYIRKYSVVRDVASIDQLEAQSRQLCAGHRDLAYVHNILKRYTTLNLQDGHSFFWTPAEWKDYNQGSAKVSLSGLVNYPTGKMLKEGIGYIQMKVFASLDPKILQTYIDSLQTILRTCDAAGPKGWILDISENGGGNAFAMLTALGPLLGEGVCGYSKSADGSKRTRIYKGGATYWDQNLVLKQDSPVLALSHADLPVAVVYGNQTGSAGEVVAISFIGKPNARSFGQHTSGATTRVDNLILHDGAALNLACGWDVDRNGKVYEAGVEPDTTTGTHEEALAAAKEWILKQGK